MIRLIVLFLFITCTGFASTKKGNSDQEKENFGYIAKLKSDGAIDFIGNKNSVLSSWNSALNLTEQKMVGVDIVKEGKKYYLIGQGVSTETTSEHIEIKHRIVSVMELVEKDSYLYVTALVCTIVTTDEAVNVRPKGMECVLAANTQTNAEPYKTIAKDTAIVGIKVNLKVVREYYKKHGIAFDL